MRVVIKTFKPAPWWTEAIKDYSDPAAEKVARAIGVDLDYVYENPGKAHRLLHEVKDETPRLKYEEAHDGFDDIGQLMDYLWARFKWENRDFLKDHDGSMNHWDRKRNVIQVKEPPHKLFMDGLKKTQSRIAKLAGYETEVRLVESGLSEELEKIFKR